MFWLLSEPSWVDRYPLHRAAHEGDAKAIKDLLKEGHSACEKDKNHWAPIHYAAWSVSKNVMLHNIYIFKDKFYYFVGTRISKD